MLGTREINSNPRKATMRKMASCVWSICILTHLALTGVIGLRFALDLLHARKGEASPGQLLHHLGLWVLLQLGVRVGWRGPGTGSAPLRQDALVHLLSIPCPCESFVDHTKTLRKLRSTRYRFFPPRPRGGCGGKKRYRSALVRQRSGSW